MRRPKLERLARAIPNDNQIATFFHCRICLEELPVGESPESYARLNIGFTSIGLQVWCVRHDVNVAHVDFEDQKHPANMRRKGDH